MVYLPVSHLARTESARPSRLAAIVSHVADFLRLFGAATRVAAAVEMRREPRPADLRQLGIKGRLPASW